MKNSKSIMIVIAAVVIVSAVVVGAIFLFKGISPDTGTDTPTSAESTSFPAISEQELMAQAQSAIQEVLEVAVEEGEEVDELITLTESVNGYEVLSCEQVENSFVATVRVYAPDLYSIAKELDENQSFENDDEMRQAVIEAIHTADIVERDVSVQYVMTENGLEPVLNMEFFNAYYGGILQLLTEAINNRTEDSNQ